MAQRALDGAAEATAARPAATHPADRLPGPRASSTPRNRRDENGSRIQARSRRKPPHCGISDCGNAGCSVRRHDPLRAQPAFGVTQAVQPARWPGWSAARRRAPWRRYPSAIHAIREAQCEIGLVQAGDHRGAGTRQCSQSLQDADLLRRVQVVGGLVQQIDRGRLHQQPGYGGTALLAARQCAQFARRQRAQPHIGERAVDAPGVGRIRFSQKPRCANRPNNTDSCTDPWGAASGSWGRNPSRRARRDAPSTACRCRRAIPPGGRRSQSRQRTQQQ